MSESLNILLNLTRLSIWTRSRWAWSCCLSLLYCIWLCWLRCNWFNRLKLNWVCIYRLCWWDLSILCGLSILNLLSLWECNGLCLLIWLIRSRLYWLSWNIKSLRAWSLSNRSRSVSNLRWWDRLSISRRSCASCIYYLSRSTLGSCRQLWRLGCHCNLCLSLALNLLWLGLGLALRLRLRLRLGLRLCLDRGWSWDLGLCLNLNLGSLRLSLSSLWLNLVIL